jgi:hypothetical protein
VKEQTKDILSLLVLIIPLAIVLGLIRALPISIPIYQLLIMIISGVIVFFTESIVNEVLKY